MVGFFDPWFEPVKDSPLGVFGVGVFGTGPSLGVFGAGALMGEFGGEAFGLTEMTETPWGATFAF